MKDILRILCPIYSQIWDYFVVAENAYTDLTVGELEAGNTEHDLAHGDHEVLREQPQNVDAIGCGQRELSRSQHVCLRILDNFLFQQRSVIFGLWAETRLLTHRDMYVSSTKLLVVM